MQTADSSDESAPDVDAKSGAPSGPSHDEQAGSVIDAHDEPGRLLSTLILDLIYIKGIDKSPF